jgi:phospholipid-binding lipoprotein MlaA
VIVNDLLQLKWKQAISDTGRFLINSTIGILGSVDVATSLGLTKHEEDFGQTLGYWGIDSGPYLVVPFFGPNSFRDVLGRGVDFFLDPRVYYTHSKDTETQRVMLTTNFIKAVDTRAGLLSAERVVDTAALDKYIYFRDAYLQRRRYLVYDGHPPDEADAFDEEDLFDDLE